MAKDMYHNPNLNLKEWWKEYLIVQNTAQQNIL